MRKTNFYVCHTVSIVHKLDYQHHPHDRHFRFCVDHMHHPEAHNVEESAVDAAIESLPLFRMLEKEYKRW